MPCCPHCHKEFALADIPLPKRLKRIPQDYVDGLIYNIFRFRNIAPQTYWDKTVHTFDVVQARWAVWEQLVLAGYGLTRIAAACGFNHSTIWHAKTRNFQTRVCKDA